MMLNCLSYGTMIQTLCNGSLHKPQSDDDGGAIDGTTSSGYITSLDPVDAIGLIDYRDALCDAIDPNTLDPDDSQDDSLAYSLHDLFALDPNDSLVYDLFPDSSLTHYLHCLLIAIYLCHALLIALVVTYSACFLMLTQLA